MYREFYDFLKEDNKIYADQLKIEDSPLKYEIILTQQKILQLLSVLDRSITEIEKSTKNKVKKSTQKVQDTVEKSEVEIKEKLPEFSEITDRKVNLPNLYEFKRGIIGGTIPELNAFVSEETVRQQELHHGDLAVAYTYMKNGKKEFAFLLEERRFTGEKECRIQFDQCIVEEIASELVCRSNRNGQLKIEESFYSPIISIQDKHEFNLQVGDIVDLAVCKKNPSKPKVIWKYEKAVVKKDKRPNDINTSKKRKRKSKKERIAKSLPLTLLGKKILIVSFEHDRSRYEREIQKRGGELLMGDANDTAERLKNLVKKSDLVIPIITNSSHHAVETVVEEAKALRVPFVPSTSKGITRNIALAEQVVMKIYN
ncbi:DUF2325 domain-containing protein [Planococcus salinus]|uniref:DUF2325 domain-containing protein n=1 Tax=Planococcus salinus TaxID=1848460 RepID=A0A3M8P848_9BACL|nr:DUF2325 domain-containing protein [Planococcus salinus]RNF39601.1 DUF2325 domain-containing protein [Planococcus salinus]